MSPQALAYLSREAITKKNYYKRQDTAEIFSTDPEEIERFENEYLAFLYLRPKINDLGRINEHFILINQKLDYNGLLVCNCETIEQRNQRIRHKYGRAAFLFYPIDFCYKRIAPKIKWLQKIYSALSHSRNRVLSRAEVAGRLCYCGFEIVKLENVDNRLHLIAKKIKPPGNGPESSSGFFYQKPCSGKDGKTFYVYKFRTMHPYAEYMRDYVLKTNGYQLSGDGVGKIDHDFRVSRWGRWMRKYWIDELPQIINILKGDLKLVGVRPVSKSFLREYPEELLKERMKHKNGLLPPSTAHIHKSIAEVIESEKIYLTAYKKHPILTDIKYFFWIVYNIVTCKMRSG